jgi:hypothetical protein
MSVGSSKGGRRREEGGRADNGECMPGTEELWELQDTVRLSALVVSGWPSAVCRLGKGIGPTAVSATSWPELSIRRRSAPSMWRRRVESGEWRVVTIRQVLPKARSTPGAMSCQRSEAYVGTFERHLAASLPRK